MQSSHRDFSAFRARLALSPSSYEKREEPTMGTLSQSLTKIGDAFADFRRKNDERIDRLETKLARPGVLLREPVATAKADEPQLIDLRTGKPALVFKAGDNIEAKMRAAGLIEDDSHEQPGLADFLRGIAGMKCGELTKKALAVGVDSAGGHLIPSWSAPGVIEALVAQSSLLQAGARVIGLGATDAGAKSYTFARVATLPTAGWRTEGGNVAESEPTFDTVQLVMKSLAFRFTVSREMLLDGLNLDGTLSRIIGQAMGVAMDAAGLRGSGTAPTPRGILNQAGVNSVTNGANGAALASWANLLSAYQLILEDNASAPTAAIMSPRSLVKLGSLTATDNQPLQRPEILSPLRMIGTTAVPNNLSVGTSSDCSEIYVGDFSRFWWGIRERMSIMSSPHTKAVTGQVEFFCHARVDCCVEYGQAFTVVSGVRP